MLRCASSDNLSLKLRSASSDNTSLFETGSVVPIINPFQPSLARSDIPFTFSFITGPLISNIHRFQSKPASGEYPSLFAWDRSANSYNVQYQRSVTSDNTWLLTQIRCNDNLSLSPSAVVAMFHHFYHISVSGNYPSRSSQIR